MYFMAFPFPSPFTVSLVTPTCYHATSNIRSVASGGLEDTPSQDCIPFIANVRWDSTMIGKLYYPHPLMCDPYFYNVPNPIYSIPTQSIPYTHSHPPLYFSRNTKKKPPSCKAEETLRLLKCRTCATFTWPNDPNLSRAYYFQEGLVRQGRRRRTQGQRHPLLPRGRQRHLHWVPRHRREAMGGGAQFFYAKNQSKQMLQSTAIGTNLRVTLGE